MVEDPAHDWSAGISAKAKTFRPIEEIWVRIGGGEERDRVSLIGLVYESDLGTRHESLFGVLGGDVEIELRPIE